MCNDHDGISGTMSSSNSLVSHVPSHQTISQIDAKDQKQRALVSRHTLIARHSVIMLHMSPARGKTHRDVEWGIPKKENRIGLQRPWCI